MDTAKKFETHPRETVLVCTSVSHGNTALVAEAMAEVLHATVVAPRDIDEATLSSADLVGFGSGIFNLNFHSDLRQFVGSLTVQSRRGCAFVFSTSGFPEPPYRRYHRRMAHRLQAKGFDVVGNFDCRGLDTWLPFKLLGGHNKNRPAQLDLNAARAFARTLSGVG